MEDENTDSPELIIAEGAESHVPAPIDKLLPDRLYLLPLHSRPFFPAQNLPIVTNAKHWSGTIERIGNTPHHMCGLVLARAEEEPAGREDFASTGTVVRMHHPAQEQGRIQFIAEGLQRFRIARWLTSEPPFLVQVQYPQPPAEDSGEIKAYALAIINTIKELLPLNPLYKEQLRAFLERFNPDEASALTDFAAALTSSSAEELQEILETVPLLRRMEKTLSLLQKEREVAGLQAEIRKTVEDKISESQRQFFLREQLKVIQQELGISKDDKTVEMDRFKERIEDLSLPEQAQSRIDEELQKFSFLETGSPEYAVTRNYLDVITSLPWGRMSEDHFDLDAARRILDADHEGLEDIKQRIIEFLAVGAFGKRIAGSILLLVGPPGVGKSSIGRSIATALGRSFYRFSLGGMRDEAEIKGHRRTYIGAMPGKFIQAIRETGTANPVVMLDEVDKIGASFHGDPASALLEVLDPELNRDFLDHYLDVRFDLSKVLFICTANQLDTIPPPLLDRMEQIRLAGYITEEKVAIARRHLWPRVRQSVGVDAKRLGITAAALRKVAESYAREAGVRSLEKQLRRIARKAVVKLLADDGLRLRIGVADVPDYLGQPVFKPERRASDVGVITGLAWTAMGGAVLNVEASKVHDGGRGLKLTGQLGDVMQESAQIAYSFVSSRANRFGGDTGFFDNAHVHLHVPEGATPKDGPSAGITMATALLSLALGRKPVRRVAMTGELTLTGEVLPVGGIREKVVAAKRARIKSLIMPAANEPDFGELPEHLRAGLEVSFVERFDEVAGQVLGGRGRRRGGNGSR